MTSKTHALGAQHWCNRPLVRETDERRLRSLWRTLLALLLAIAPTAVYLVHRNECIKLSYQVRELQDARTVLIEEEQRLRAERAQLESLAEIERWALRDGGLRHPAAEEVIVVAGDRAASAGWLARAPRPVDGKNLH